MVEERSAASGSGASSAKRAHAVERPDGITQTGWNYAPARSRGCSRPTSRRATRRASRGSQLDLLEPVLRRLAEWPQIEAPRLTEILRADYGYTGSLPLVQARLRELPPWQVRPAQRTDYRPGQVLRLDWTEMPTRRRWLGRSDG